MAYASVTVDPYHPGYRCLKAALTNATVDESFDSASDGPQSHDRQPKLLTSASTKHWIPFIFPNRETGLSTLSQDAAFYLRVHKVPGMFLSRISDCQVLKGDDPHILLARS